MPTLPLTLESLTAGWFDEVLRESGLLRASHVIHIEQELVGEGAGVFGQLARIVLTYDSPEPGAPATLIAKMAAAAAENRAIATDFDLYERELRFYEELASACPVRVPRCFYAARGSGVGEFILLLEDLSSANGGDQVAGATLDQARLALSACARINAWWWGRAELPDLAWLPSLDA
jgi:hypothetical protein